MATQKPQAPRIETAPDQRKLTTRQAARLSSVSDVSAKELTGLTIAEASQRFKWQIDPNLFFFRRICGRVVKKDPVTNVEYPVPFATVTVEDTDCTLISYFPNGWPWGWFFPLNCHREVIATVQTDECGRFCVYVPRFDIDWILRWRHERICFPVIFYRPTIADLLDRLHLPPLVRDPIGPKPGPDPGPWEKLLSLPQSTLEAITGAATRKLAPNAASAGSSPAFGGKATSGPQSLDARAFDRELPPPLPQALQQVRAGAANVVAQKGQDPHEAVRATVAAHAGVNPKDLATLDFNHFIGPFRRCIDVYIPEWQLIVDVPDITFRVSQDVNGDGTLDTIYSEGYFDVRWNAGAIPDVTLVASSIAREVRTCETPTVVCKDVPEIQYAGMLDLGDATIFNATTGYVLRTNRPKPPAMPRPAAATPFHGTLQLYGCAKVAGAAFYRVLAKVDAGPFTAITGAEWNIAPYAGGAPQHVSADASGWYPVLTHPELFHLGDMLVEWATPPLGKCILKVETANAAKAHLGFSAEVALQVDNLAPSAIFTTLAWKFDNEPDSAYGLPGRDLLVPCPTIRRGAPARTIDVKMDVAVSAHHLRRAVLGTGGCGGGSFVLTSAGPTDYWHHTVTDNSVMLSATYRLDAASLEGAYSFSCDASSRAMNPSGGDGGNALAWWYDPQDIWVNPTVNVAIVNG